jgi:hypothetical protein
VTRSQQEAIRAPVLATHPPGTLEQNIFRCVLNGFVLNFLGRRSQFDSIDAARESAIRVVRQWYPGFEPTTAV